MDLEFIGFLEAREIVLVKKKTKGKRNGKEREYYKLYIIINVNFEENFQKKKSIVRLQIRSWYFGTHIWVYEKSKEIWSYTYNWIRAGLMEGHLGMVSEKYQGGYEQRGEGNS